MQPTLHENSDNVVPCDEAAYWSFFLQGGLPAALPIPLGKSLAVKPGGTAAGFGHLFLRVSAGLMIFYIHGRHKLEGWIAYHQHGTPWKRVGEVTGIHFPAPLSIGGCGIRGLVHLLNVRCR